MVRGCDVMSIKARDLVPGDVVEIAGLIFSLVLYNIERDFFPCGVVLAYSGYAEKFSGRNVHG